MMLDATRNFEAPLTKERMFDWHASLFPTGRNGMGRITVGAWRTKESGPMQVVSGWIGNEHVHFEAPEAERLEAEMTAFLKMVSNAPLTIDPVLKAGVCISGLSLSTHLKMATDAPCAQLQIWLSHWPTPHRIGSTACRRKFSRAQRLLFEAGIRSAR